MRKIKNLALVDDDDIYVFLTSKTIKSSNLVDEIKIFDNGQKAIDFLKTNFDNIDLLPEVILLDLAMPVMDGWQFLDEFVKINSKIRKTIVIYICSSSISPHDLQKAKEINEVTDFIIKPLTKEKLIETIKNLK